ncbi:type II toxin-antitoxin system RelE/ParE family toxin [Runella limosa]|uniref:type II toxin-antitoxin system RelE/ParE family toxin n=1 Tax=Runella limosa TaxID=370978 RepID=UPI00048FBD6D|nr:type II toxin-antitoxin system RelE/ParE family toxin [Runella limosa]MCA0232139.1 type II toxin-antitoxin system RelE/ParE family toxin [Bacteroidota bacterium]
MKIIVGKTFNRDFKKLAKKYGSLGSDLVKLLELLQKNPTQGTPLGQNCYKIRLAISTKNQGKSGGARVITCVKIIDEQLFLLTIYDKSEKENITSQELSSLLKELDFTG